MINLITGRPGQGKTYVLAYKAKEYLEAGYTVYSNFKLDWKAKNLHYWNDPRSLNAVTDGIIMMDEAHVYLNSREWEGLSRELQRKLQQHRKDGLHIWGTVQHEARIDVVFRELVSAFFVCKKVIGSGEGSEKPWGLIRVAQFFPEDMKRDNKVEFSAEWYLIKKGVCNFYDTLAKVVPVDDNALKHVEKHCPECGFKKVIHE